MLTCKHPWINLDEIQTLWRLGRFDCPPLPDQISKEATSFLEQTFVIDPANRPTALQLLDHNFSSLNLEEFDFRAYKAAAIAKKTQLDDEDDDSEYESESEYSEEELEDTS
jgi:serine/threonine protein kinase